MGKPTGFLEYKREEDHTVPAAERMKSFEEFHTPLGEKERREQAARCMNCGVPFCQSAMKLSGMVTGCPLHNLIPEWNDDIYHGHYRHALQRLLKTSSFPEFTGRVCPALCEKACINGIDGEPTTIHNNELFLIETAFKNGWMTPQKPAVRSGKSVAVIGAGPAGLAVADRLNKRGHSVTVYERDDRVGGLLMYGIPNMKLDKSIVERRKNLMEEEGVIFKTGVNVGKDIAPKQLLKEFDAVVLACGAKKARPLAIKDFDKIGGVYYAVDFLKSTTKSLLDTGLKDGTYVSAKGKNVVIVGGGDTGNDCTGTCMRHGAKSVTQLEMMPMPPVERLASNPWPEWPKVLKTDYGQQEVIEKFCHDPRIYETTVKEIHQKNGKITEIVTVKVKFENRKMVEIAGTEKVLPCDLLLIAAGFIGCEDYVADAFGVTRTQRGVVATPDPDQYKTNVDKVFTAGDMHRGQSLVVWAITEGRKCAKEVDKYLMGYSNLE
ncbi:MAG: glutamate synthase subunit beta [Eubacteriales bacterium]|nr:glutamate synthase subunit beta [Eubacteriales bacterium]